MTTSRPQKRPSESLGGITADSAQQILRRSAKLLLGRLPKNNGDYAALGARIGKAARGRAYSGSYIKYIMLGKQVFSAAVRDGAKNLIAELEARPPRQDYQTVTVKVVNGYDVPAGTIVQRSARTCVCGVSFIPTAWNQKSHTTACAKLRSKTKR